ncbi:MAG: DUF3662 domain-containing protein [Anaerolineae bacterium]|nr:DUF3662 domain-containing protein [Anaerolineae bacterium]
MNQLDRFERLAQRLIEVPFQRLFQPQLHPADLTDQLALAIEEGRQNGRGHDLIPNHYQILINSADYAQLVKTSNCDAIVTELYTYLSSLAAETNWQFAGPLRVLLEQDETIKPGSIKITADYVPALAAK